MYDKNLLSELLTNSDCKSIDAEGNVLPPSDPIYVHIAMKMAEKESSISPKHIYTILRTNRNGMHNIVLRAFGVTQKFDTSVDDSVNTTTEKSSPGSVRKFRLVVSAQNWAEMKPENKMYGGRRYVKLKPGKWTHIIAEKIWDQTRLPCAIAFKSGKVSVGGNAECFASFQGMCKECGASLVGKMFSKPSKDKDAFFECTISGFDSQITHVRKRQLKGYLREQVASQLVDGKKEATVWRTEEAKRLMEVGDRVPPILYNANVLRKAKQEEADQRLNLICNDPFQNLYHAKYNEHANAIRAIGMDPFYCMYWSKEQLELYKIEHRNPNSCFLIDASGGFAKKLILPNETLSPHLFLYQCVLINDERSVPVFQMISAKQDAALISYFLLEIRRAGAPIPRVVISDFGRAILAAVSRAFANCSDLKSYLQICYDLAVTCTKTVVPSCYLRLDVSHLIAMVARWECLRHKPTKVRQFYIRCIAQAYKLQSLTELSQLLQSVMVVALSEEIGRDENGVLVPSETYLRHANNIIKGTIVEDEVTEYEGDGLADLEMNDVSDSWVHWSSVILQQAKDVALLSKNGDVLSAFFNPPVAEKLKSLMAHLPLWTGVMRQYFKIGNEIATSSAVEALFSDYKNRAFKGSLPTRVDKFVIKHLDYLDGKLLLACAGKNINGDRKESPRPSNGGLSSLQTQKIAEIDTSSNLKDNSTCLEISSSSVAKDEHKDINDFSKDKVDGNSTPIENSQSADMHSNTSNHLNMTSIDSVANDSSYRHTNESSGQSASLLEVTEVSHDLDFKENWRGLQGQGETKRRTSQPKCAISKRKRPNYLDPCPDWDSANPVAKVGIPMMQNGNSCNPISLEGKLVAVRKTCAFDSILYVLTHIIAMEPANQSYPSEGNPTVDPAKVILSSGKITAKHYTERGAILNSTGLYKITTYTRKYHLLDAECNAAHLAERLFLTLPSLQRSKKCNSCELPIIRNFPVVNTNVNILLRDGFGFLQESIDDAFAPTDLMCNKCNSLFEITYENGPYSIIDTSIVSDKNYTKNIDLPFKGTKLADIAKNIDINNRSYGLKGLVVYVGGHYHGIVYTGLTWYVYDDLRPRKFQVTPDYIVAPHVLLYARNLENIQ